MKISPKITPNEDKISSQLSMCELLVCRLSMHSPFFNLGFPTSFHTILPALVGEGLVLGGSTDDTAEQYLFWCFMVSISSGVGRFAQMVKGHGGGEGR